MKVLQVNCVYGKGSTGKIVADLHHGLLDRGIESVVCYGRGERSSEPNVYKTCGELYSKLNNLLTRFTGLMYGGCFFSTGKLIRRIRKEQPDIVHLHCINGYFVNIYRLITWLKRQKIKTVLTLHAEFMYTANCGHALECDKWKTGCGNCPRLRQETKSLLLDNTARSWARMKKAFSGFEENLVVTSVSPWLMERAKESPILGDKYHCVVMNGVDTDVFHPYDTWDLRKKHGLGEEKVIFHATPYFSSDPNHLKGGCYVLQLAEMLKDQPVRIFVAGNYDKNIRVPENMTLLGQITDREALARYYSMADVTVLTSKKETFSMVTAESLCCGTPVVGFEAGAPERIALPRYSRFVEYGDMEALYGSICEQIDSDGTTMQIAKNACERYSKESMNEAYLEVYLQVNGAN